MGYVIQTTSCGNAFMFHRAGCSEHYSHTSDPAQATVFPSKELALYFAKFGQTVWPAEVLEHVSYLNTVCPVNIPDDIKPVTGGMVDEYLKLGVR